WIYALIALVVITFSIDIKELPEVEMNYLQKEVINTALSMVGGTYSWGAYDPKNRTFDCWNFVTWVYHHVLDKDGGVKHMLIGIDDPLWVFFDNVKDLQPGDVLMNGGGHTVGFHAGIYYGKGFTIEARGGNYGIGVFRIEGGNPYCPYGETGLRFCFYSLLVRLWLNPKPDFSYVYFKLNQSFFFSDEGAILELHSYSPVPAEVKISIDVIDYENGKILKTLSIEDYRVESTEKIENIKINLDGISGYVYFRVKMYDKKGRLLFEYDDYINGNVEII
ncbi:MAG: C40 family peptidase, partial [Thermotogaceae bacterium]|nr:C40 family peptidase [Thermotogaceae bacterium]